MTSANQRANVNAPAPLDWQDLIASARRSIDSQQPESRAANHRAISTAYYAAYDGLCESNATVLVPQVTDQASADAWVRVYRGSSHGHAVGNLQRHSASLSPDGQDFAVALESLYDARRRADYSPRSVFKPSSRRALPDPGGSGHRETHAVAAVRTDRHRDHHPAARPLTSTTIRCGLCSQRRRRRGSGRADRLTAPPLAWGSGLGAARVVYN